MRVLFFWNNARLSDVADLFFVLFTNHTHHHGRKSRLAWHAERTEVIKNINICTEKI
jgi:hypothetical protein